MHEKKFTLEDQNIFAKLSGDYSKMHIDDISARRYLFGGLVVHGIHLLLWALDKWLEKLEKPVELISLRTSFRKPLPVGESVKYRLICEDSNYVEFELYGEEQVYVVISGNWKFADTKEVDNLDLRFPQCKNSRVLTLKELMNASGVLDLCVEMRTASELFPNLVKNLPLIQMAQILVTTRLVAMECPGLHSVFGELDVSFDSMISGSSNLEYKVVKFDDRFSLLIMEVKGPSMKGIVKAFLRPLPRKQKSFSDLSKIITPNEFKDQCVLIIGGSRGLGEVTSKLLAAGGSKIILTYFKGHDDARKVADEIISGGGKANIINFNVLVPEETQFDKAIMASITHLYYFATPHITATSGMFSTRVFRDFCDYYVSGFSNTLEFFLKHAPTIRKIFYPSSVFVEKLPLSFKEYSMAKATGEVLCSFLEKAKKDVSIYKPRLPKMATDQTIGMMSDDSKDPAPIMLKQVREFRNYSK